MIAIRVRIIAVRIRARALRRRKIALKVRKLALALQIIPHGVATSQHVAAAHHAAAAHLTRWRARSGRTPTDRRRRRTRPSLQRRQRVLCCSDRTSTQTRRHMREHIRTCAHANRVGNHAYRYSPMTCTIDRAITPHRPSKPHCPRRISHSLQSVGCELQVALRVSRHECTHVPWENSISASQQSHA
jgi:hypothetical protein